MLSFFSFSLFRQKAERSQTSFNGATQIPHGSRNVSCLKKVYTVIALHNSLKAWTHSATFLVPGVESSSTFAWVRATNCIARHSQKILLHTTLQESCIVCPQALRFSSAYTEANVTWSHTHVSTRPQTACVSRKCRILFRGTFLKSLNNLLVPECHFVYALFTLRFKSCWF